MESIEPPSFSLGLDLDGASDPQPESGSYQYRSSPGEDEHGFSSPVLKRLRRPNSIDSAKDDRGVASELLGCKEDRNDDIEDLSSPDTDAPASTRSHFSSFSPRVPLNGSGVISRAKRKQLDDVPASAGSGIASVASLFQRSTRSPLRMFQLLDSDSEDDHPSTIRVTKRKVSGSMSCMGDLWKDFPPGVSKIQTPALDDVCQDYFSSIKTSNTAVASSSNTGFDHLTGFQQTQQFLDISQPSPPSHRFFLHSDPRIQNLARQRLPNFLPLGIVNVKDSREEVSLIDYMNQFGSNDSSKTGVSSIKSCRRGQPNSKVSKRQECAQASEGWLNPKARSAAPNDAGKRRVTANSGSAGHWFTSPEGRKVYISKSGQEFSGQSAYRCYKKETGGGFNKSSKKRQPKKKAKNL
ncbi:unnamed protein product [Microthlaspi erraticum]|uniref:Uncharacterized protein n=1 Tax=Microthlaspi erraticum TaxID=1685480 RepID=A0A6D2J5Q0_9BRAS|nr:unnamed protein product [Microthlaspi erraticum]